MKVLLIGEFSGLHSNLMSGLIKLGCHVDMISYGDTFKKFDSGINVSSVRKFPFSTLENELNIPFKSLVKSLGKYDVVQFVNPLVTHTRLQIAVGNLKINNELILSLIEKAEKSFLLAAGDDHFYIKAVENNLFKYSPFQDSLIYDMPLYKRWFSQCWNNDLLRSWNQELVDHVNGIIPCAYEYDIGYTNLAIKNKKNYIPFPFDINSVVYSENKITNRLNVVHGLNRYGSKGTKFVERAFSNLKYHKDINCKILNRLSYNEFCKSIQNSNVVIDQLNSYSYAYTAINALAMGKVVISGCEQVILDKYNIKECSALINGTPDSEDLAKKITEISSDVYSLRRRGEEGRDFVNENHNYIKIAKKYLETWGC
jgi:hypothetical protein